MADTDLIERVNVIAGLLVLSPEQSEALMDAATALAEKDARIAEWQEPPLTCPHIDAAIASGELSDGVKAELAEIRDINSQLRYGTWALRSQLTASRAECEGLRAALEDSLPAMNATERLASIKAAGYPRSEEEMLHRIIDNFLDKRRAALSQKENGDAA